MVDSLFLFFNILLYRRKNHKMIIVCLGSGIADSFETSETVSHSQTTIFIDLAPGVWDITWLWQKHEGCCEKFL
jgi:hypothetical protein